MEQRLNRIAVALERIAEALERVLIVPMPSVSSFPEPCAHPDRARVDLSSMGMEEWICSPQKGGCGYRYRAAIVDDMVLGQLQG